MSVSCSLLLIILTFNASISSSNENWSEHISYKIENDTLFRDEVEIPGLSSGENFDNIETVFNSKLAEYTSQGYFSQIYEPSLQATYYTLYILDVIGKLGEINTIETRNYIMSLYNTSSHIFMDKYSYRYLDYDSDEGFYPYTSVLEVNCYALLSLDILNSLNLISTQDSIDFIWSCYHPTTSGFIGQPYNPSILGEFKNSTMDNTYYAIITLDMLMGGDWNGSIIERDDLINFIGGLQSTNPLYLYFGGFYNTENLDFDILEKFEPNLLTCYYSIKSLDVFGMVGTIRTADFHDYLDGLYDIVDNFFQFSYMHIAFNDTDIIASALGLEISDLTSFSVNRPELINFILENKNALGIWNNSRSFTNYELIDTFQVIRSLNEAGEISQLNSAEKEQIVSALELYSQYKGYSLISNNFVSNNLLNTIISAFKLYDRISDLDIVGLYSLIEGSYYEEFSGSYGFCECTGMDYGLSYLRSYPIEYNYMEKSNYLLSHRATYLALSSMEKIFKLDDFEISYDLMDIANSIVDSQFLEGSYDNFGAFLPYETYTLLSTRLQDLRVSFELSYYAIKALEVLANYLSLDNITEFGVNGDALYTYIFKNIGGGPTTLYFDSQYTDNVEELLRDTYYMIYILKTIDQYNLDTQKINNFVVQNLDYNNFKNIYYSYKISNILDLDIQFDLDLTHALVEDIFSDQNKEYYLTMSHETMDQEIFLWICDMAKNDNVRINPGYDGSVQLGGLINISATLCNIILKDFGPYATVKFESSQIGTITLEKQADNSYQKDVFIPVISDNYPTVDGSICMYDSSIKKAEAPVSFQTTYGLEIKGDIFKNTNDINIIVNVSLISAIERQAVYNGEVYAEFYQGLDQIGPIYLTPNHDAGRYSLFSLNYIPQENGIYEVKVYLKDGFNPNPLYILNTTYSYNAGTPDNVDKNIGSGKNYDGVIAISIPLCILLFAAPASLMFISSKVNHKTRLKSRNQ